MITIYFEEKRVVICDGGEDFSLVTCCRPIIKPSAKEIEILAEEIALKWPTKDIIIIADNVIQCYNALFSKFQRRVAAGGVVRDTAGNTLFILHRDKWDIPKGLLEEGESLEDCAVREVMEECSIERPTIVSFLKITRHCYRYMEQPVLKETHWFNMLYIGAKQPEPQIEEEIYKAEFIAPENIEMCLANSYASIKELL